MKLRRDISSIIKHNYSISLYDLWFFCAHKKFLIYLFCILLFECPLKGDSEKRVSNEYSLPETSLLLDLEEQVSICFEGNSFFSTETLQKKLFIHEDLGFVEPHLIVNDLLSYYKDYGFIETQITFHERYLNKIRTLVFHIIEGKRVKINDIYITGALEPTLNQPLLNILGKIKEADYFDKIILNDLLSEIKTLFSSYGYWNFTLKNYQFIPNKYSTYDLLMEFDQGTQRLLHNIVIQNDNAIDKDLSTINLPSLKEAIPFDLSLIDNYKHKIEEIVALNDATICVEKELIKTETQSDTLKENYQLVFRLMQNRTYFGDIIIEGCERTLPSIIMRNLAFKEGDLWDFGKIEQSLKRLKDLNIFKSISIVPNDFLEPSEYKMVKITVVEDSIFEMITRAGIAQESELADSTIVHYFPGMTYKLGGSFLWKNIRGLADVLRVDFDYTGFSTNFGVSYRRPLSFKYLPDMYFDSKVFNNQITQSLPGLGGNNRQNVLFENHKGLLFNVESERNDLKLLLSTGLDCLKISTDSMEVLQRFGIDTNFFKNTVPYWIIEPSVIINKFDNDINPTKGFRTALSFKAMLSLNNLSSSFYKFLFEHAHVVPLTSFSSLAMRFKVGYIWSNSNETILPTERFYLGGFNTIRAYEQNMASPLNAFYPENNAVSAKEISLNSPNSICQINNKIPLGGKFMMNLNTEWRCAVYGKLSAAIFNDIGLLNNNFRDLTAKNIVGGSGLGLIYTTPVGPIRFDIGFKWRREKDEKPYNWYLTFGQSF